MKLETIFPYISVMFSVNGISSSEAQRQKESNKNLIDHKKHILEYNTDKLYDKYRAIISESTTRNEKVESIETINPSDFELLKEFAELNSKSAILGCSLKEKESIINFINELSYESIAGYFGITLPVFNRQYPKKNELPINIERYCAIEKVEELFKYANKELLDEIKEYYVEGMQVEAQAAVYGKYVVNEDSPLRLIVKSKPIINKSTFNSTNFIIESYERLNIDLNEFKQLEEELMEHYTSLQKRRNMIMKIIKDKARELVGKYETEYSKELQEYNKENKCYVAMLSEIQSQCNIIKNELLQEAASLKIAI